MITLGKLGTVHARRQALSYLMDTGVCGPAVQRGGEALRRPQRRIHAHHAHAMFARAMRAEMAYIELLGAEQELDAKRQKRSEARTKKREEIASRWKSRILRRRLARLRGKG